MFVGAAGGRRDSGPLERRGDDLAGACRERAARVTVQPSTRHRAHRGRHGTADRSGRRRPISRWSRTRCAAATPTERPPERTEPGSRRSGRQIQAANGRPVVVPEYRVDRVRVTLEPAEGQSPPTVVARVVGTVALVTYEGSPPAVTKRAAPVRFSRTVELALEHGRYLIARVRGAGETEAPLAPTTRSEALGGVELRDVAAQVGLDFKQGAFRFGVAQRARSDDGRRPLLDRLRRRRLARPVRRQRLCGRGLRALDGERRPAPQCPVPQRARQVRGREPRLGRRPAAPRQRLRRGRLQPGRPRGPLRDDRGLQRRHQRLRRAPVGTR